MPGRESQLEGATFHKLEFEALRGETVVVRDNNDEVSIGITDIVTIPEAIIGMNGIRQVFRKHYYGVLAEGNVDLFPAGSETPEDVEVEEVELVSCTGSRASNLLANEELAIRRGGSLHLSIGASATRLRARVSDRVIHVNSFDLRRHLDAKSRVIA